MSLIFACADVPPEPWITAIGRRVPDIPIHVWPEHGPPEDVEFAVLWGGYASEMAQFPNLRVLLSLGAGVDHILDAPGRPEGVPVVRLADPALKTGMVEYVLYNVLRFHRRFPEYEEQQSRKLWIERSQTLPGDRRVGVLGLGTLGAACATALADLGFDVMGWSRDRKTIDRVRCYNGDEGLPLFLEGSEILVCLLPLTAETRGILDARTLSALPSGAYLINPGRGGHLVEQDLLEALDSGQIAAAALDVFQTEPLPGSHPFWTHPRVTITPHVAALVSPESAAEIIADTIHRSRHGLPLLNIADPARGY